MADLIEHLESYLGVIADGVNGDDTTPSGVQVVRFGPDSPFPGMTTLATLGLSHHHLHGLHQEVLIHLRTEGLPPNAAGVLFQVAGELIERGQGLLRGEVLGPRGRLFAKGEMTALLAAIPVYLPSEFAVCETPAFPVVLTWLVPITTGEADVAVKHGWDALEDTFVIEDPDLANPLRAEIELDRLH